MEDHITIGLLAAAAVLFVGPWAWSRLKSLWPSSGAVSVTDWPSRQVTHLRALAALDGDLLATDAKPHTDALRVMVATRAPTVTGGKP